jgi:hypothetical protein
MRPEYDASETYWESAGPRFLSYSCIAHRSITERRLSTMLLDSFKFMRVAKAYV